MQAEFNLFPKLKEFLRERKFTEDENVMCMANGWLKEWEQLKGSVKEPNKFHIHETEKITRKASDAAEYIELFGSFTRDRHARRI